MAVPSYTEDLTDLDLADGAAGWDESSNGAWDDSTGAAPGYEDAEYPFIQGLYAVTYDCTKSGRGSLISSNYGTGFTVPADGAILIWTNFSSPSTLDTYVNGGIGVIVGNSYGDFYNWDCGGNDYGTYPYGGWQNFAVDPSDAATGADAPAASDTVGTPSGTWSYFGASINTLAGISKGEVFQVDAIRGGRCSAIFENGEAADYCTIDGFATENDYNDVTNGYHRWGLIQATPGGYLWKGRMALGTSGTAVDFRDSNKVIFIQDTPNVSANFNTIEVENASSNVEMTGFQFICLDATNTNSKGRWLTTNDATVALTSCSFVDMSTFVFDSNTTLVTCLFNRCAQITTGSCDMGGSSLLESTAAVDTGSLYCDTAYTDTYFDNMTFSMGTNAHHAIDFGTLVTSSFTLRNVDFSGFGSTANANDSTVRFLATSGSLTLSLINCTVDGAAATTGNFSVDDAAMIGGGVTVSINPVTTEINIQDPDGNPEENVRVYLEAADGTGDLPFEESVTITRGQGVGNSTAVVSHTAHGLEQNEYVKLGGIINDEADNSGAFQIAYIDDNSYSYTSNNAGNLNYTGTIIATGATIYGLTVGGSISSSRTYGANQPLRGYARKLHDTVIYFKAIELNATVNSSNGLTISRRLVSDGKVV